MPWEGIIIFIVSVIALIKISRRLVALVVDISNYLEVGIFIIAFFLVAFANSLPEVVISVMAASRGESSLAFGNAVGSNIIYASLLIGLVTIIAGRLRIIGEKRAVSEDTIFASLIAVLPFILMYDLNLSRLDGVILILTSFIYFRHILARHNLLNNLWYRFNNNDGSFILFLKNIGLFMVWAAMLIVASWGIVYSASGLADALGVSLIIIGMFMVAFGAMIPDLTFTIQSVIKGHREMVAGDLFGAVVINAGFALGLAALISPIYILNVNFFLVAAFFTFFSFALMGIFARTSEFLSLREGVGMILIYVAFIITQFFVK